MPVFDSYCATFGKPVRLASGDLPHDGDARPVSSVVMCLDCGSECPESDCPIAGTSSTPMTHRLARRGWTATPEPIAAECPTCGARTIHDLIVGRFAICRACGAARSWTDVRGMSHNATEAGRHTS